MQRTAILVDGAFFLARYRKIWGDRDVNDTRAIAKALFGMTLEHLKALDRPREALYRIYFYDCPPLEKTLLKPVSAEPLDLARTGAAGFRRDLHDQLRRQRKLVLRLGRLADRGEWQLKRQYYQPLHEAHMEWEDLGDEHFEPDMRQTQVDIQLGLDVASLAYKKLVDQIILVSADTDVIPAAKLARDEGIDFILDPMWQGIASDLHEHIDGLQSVCPRPV